MKKVIFDQHLFLSDLKIPVMWQNVSNILLLSIPCSCCLCDVNGFPGPLNGSAMDELLVIWHTAVQGMAFVRYNIANSDHMDMFPDESSQCA